MKVILMKYSLTITRAVLVMIVVLNLHLKQLNIGFFIENMKNKYICSSQKTLKNIKKKKKNLVCRLVKSLYDLK